MPLTGKQKVLVKGWRVTQDGMTAFQKYIAVAGEGVESAKEVLTLRKALRILRDHIHSMDPDGETAD